MGPETLAGIAAATAAGITKEVFAALIQGAFEASGASASGALGDKARGAIKRWNAERGLKQLRDRGKQIRKVKTIWQVERELDLLKFYYPSKIKSSVDGPRVVHQLSDFPFEGNIIVRGTVGQGKSIFLRYLTARELSRGERIPVFLELRRLGTTPVLDAIYRELKNLGVSEASEEVFEFFAENGRLALMLDGFDELEEEQVARVIVELESLAVRFEALRIVITSRPDASVEHSPHFRVFDLAPLAPGEFAKVVERIAHDPGLAEEIVTRVNRGHQSIVALLTTPLMVALLVVHFRVGNGVPENRVAFFDPLFMLLLQRHDKAKAGYVRRRRSSLSDSELLSFFNCLCFVTRKEGVGAMSERDITAAASKALTHTSLDSKPDHAVEDIRRIACLILKEGEEFRFLHKSVQEFHSACFIRDQPEELIRDLYGRMQGRWHVWQQELIFLETIDKFRFNRLFAIPILERVISTLPDAEPAELGRALISRLFARVAVRPRPEFQSFSYPLDHIGWCLTHHFEGSSELLAEIAAASVEVVKSKPRPEATEHRDLPFHDLLPVIGGNHPVLLAAAEQLGVSLRASLKKRRQAVHVVEERKGLLDI